MNAIVDQFFNDVNNDFIDSPFEYKLTVRHFANKTVDYVVHKIKHRVPKLHKDGAGIFISYRDKNDEQKRQDNIERSARRAKQLVGHAIRSIGADHMLTLHTRANITQRDDFFKLFTRFIHLVRTKHLINGRLSNSPDKRYYPFCAVPEKQERGAYHMHIAVVGKQDIPFLRACWYVALGGTESDKGTDVLGNIDVTAQSKRFSDSSTKCKTYFLIEYLTKYITKSFEDDDSLGIHRYTKSRGNPPVITNKQYLMASFSNGGKGFVDAIKEVIEMAKFQGIGDDYTMFNRNEELLIIRGNYS